MQGAGSVVASGAAPAATAIPGWPGGAKPYLGRYHLVSSSDANIAKSGMLTIFTRIVPHQPAPVISGILALYSMNGTNALYLSHFLHTGLKLTATVNLGIYTGPKIATFVVVSRNGPDMMVKFVPVSGTVISMHFMRFSLNPHP
jgi:hypothetical protein